MIIIYYDRKKNDHTFLDQLHFKNSRIYKKHPKYSDFAASSDGHSFNIDRNSYTNIESICGHSKIRVGEYYSHSMLLEHFIFECFFGVLPPDFFIIHKDDDHSNNKLDNLQLKHKDQLSIEKLTKCRLLQIDTISSTLKNKLNLIKINLLKINLENYNFSDVHEIEDYDEVDDDENDANISNVIDEVKHDLKHDDVFD